MSLTRDRKVDNILSNLVKGEKRIVELGYLHYFQERYHSFGGKLFIESAPCPDEEEEVDHDPDECDYCIDEKFDYIEIAELDFTKNQLVVDLDMINDYSIDFSIATGDICLILNRLLKDFLGKLNLSFITGETLDDEPILLLLIDGQPCFPENYNTDGSHDEYRITYNPKALQPFKGIEEMSKEDLQNDLSVLLTSSN